MTPTARREPTLAPERNYPFNCWWVAATAAEVQQAPLGRWLLDTPVVLYRTRGGTVAALENRCLHRWAPLSDGRLDGDVIVCPYHGARFSPDGRCERYPTQDSVPAFTQIRAFRVMERGPFVWIWMGDDAAADAAAPPPDFPFTRDPSWTVIEGACHVDANYMLLHENLLDLTHFNTLHRNSFGITNKVPPRYWVEGDIVRSHIAYDLTGQTEAERAQAGVFDPEITGNVDTGAFVTPALHRGEVNYLIASGDVRLSFQVNHFLTPESGSKTHYWWHFGASTALPGEAIAKIIATVESAFQEDQAMLSSIQRIIERDPRGRDYIELSFKGDMGGLQARQALGRILAREAVPAPSDKELAVAGTTSSPT